MVPVDLMAAENDVHNNSLPQKFTDLQVNPKLSFLSIGEALGMFTYDINQGYDLQKWGSGVMQSSWVKLISNVLSL